MGGLQILHEDQWADVRPSPGALVVNIADLLQASPYNMMVYLSFRFGSQAVKLSKNMESGKKERFTLFVENIPEERDKIWLQRTFNKFGVVKDAFKPRKRSKRTGNKFGFVRYDCHVSAGMAVARMNGVWVKNNRLFVKEACFGHCNAVLKQRIPSFHKAIEQVVMFSELKAKRKCPNSLSQRSQRWVSLG
ncbi:hypothetical protein RHMOL_Rhmol04G0303200 [Rhododendron molle]|uniref:Uncharacterized protein n=1 Tax=Rhododendron molle TaxID=49168 RepID=A0ACC0P5R5_RHOML|nr:hypothetical protein RHMOL_Rhmol04G0303200 [Rhododendron molle]